MAFSDFTYPAVLADLGLTLANSPDLFAAVPPVPASATLRATLAVNVPLAATGSTEMARSTWLVGPLLSDLWARYHGRISLFSGIDFPADPDAGLTGFCDFLLTRAPQQPTVAAPVAVIVEAKRDNINGGLGQCIAGMAGAWRFNARTGTPVEAVYGAVTTGTNWKFLRLAGAVVTLDLQEYPLADADKLLGILTHVVGPAPLPAAA